LNLDKHRFTCVWPNACCFLHVIKDGAIEIENQISIMLNHVYTKVPNVFAVYNSYIVFDMCTHIYCYCVEDTCAASTYNMSQHLKTAFT